MGMGILELKQSGTASADELFSLKEFLDRFYMSRIGMRTHMEQYLQFFASTKVHSDQWVGIFNVHCDIKDIIQGAVEYSSDLCKQNHSDAPTVEIKQYGDDANIVYCPSHLNYIMSELLKNSMRAVVEFHGEDQLDFPPIIVSIHSHEHELVIKISDKGGGIPQINHSKLFSYFYSTADSPNLELLRTDDSHFAGFGYGLALSRLHARYFGGELTICPMYGYGTDVFIHIKSVDDSKEVLPNIEPATIIRYSSSQGIVRQQRYAKPRRLSKPADARPSGKE
eukprot:CAMPEP_0116996282 /NCGR_PEP_ID=MMETSP0472-20121206/142_1 /TAXON_ID=693140 ORGANISM="Tiarina fusus, Strain LIS" /NCGR_SAMPLE_ID=MMETSP0472 /ASSEMBLY_ACC=CAM_ASM_000603 /LENGTH=280 /DNA_ID=CAMNT_0004694855 /DNA_START=458 /DNA_END=1303 /DNA_ORIENTATION=-